MLEVLLIGLLVCICALLLFVLRLALVKPIHPVSLLHPAPKVMPENLADELSNLDPLLLQSASSLAVLIRNQTVTSSHVVEIFIAQILKVNPFMNAAVAYRFDTARAEVSVDVGNSFSSRYSRKLTDIVDGIFVCRPLLLMCALSARKTKTACLPFWVFPAASKSAMRWRVLPMCVELLRPSISSSI